MNQPENQSDRATPGDVAWVEEIIDDGALQDEAHSRMRRILNSLRAPAVPVMDREALAKALCISVGTPDVVRIARERLWDEPEGGALLRSVWQDEADRLLRVLGGLPAPVVQQQPRAWEIRREGTPYCVVSVAENAQSYSELPADLGFTVTPLYALQESP